MIYVDDAAIRYKSKLRYHMAADTLEELHTFAASIGVARCWFHRTAHTLHYDICEDQKLRAIEQEAQQITKREMVEKAKRLKSTTTLNRKGM